MPISRKRWPACPIERALVVLTGRWKVMIIWRLLEGPKRYAELREAVDGLSERVLTQALAELAEDGAVTRHGPDWRLTEAGEALRPALYELFAWGHRMEIRPSELDRAE